MSKADRAQQTTIVAREVYAAQLFDLQTIERAILEKAREGFWQYRIIQSLPFDLTTETSTRQLEAWLHRESFTFEWKPVIEPTDPLRPMTGYEYQELVIDWR